MKTISREAIIRMTGGERSSFGGGAVGGGSVDLSGYALQTWVDENYLSIAFFRNLFRAYESDGTTEVLPNGEGTTIDNIKAMFGFWTDQYLSALGQNSSGGGGGGGSSTLAGLNDVQLGTLDANDVLTYDGSGHWVNTPKATLLSGYATQSWVTGTALSGYATQSWVGQQGFLTSVAFSDLTSHPTTLSGYGITDALGSGTTFWGRTASNGVVSGDMTGVGSITMSGFLYLDNGKTIYFKDTGGAYRNAITFNSLNDFAIGYHIRQQGYTTDIQGGKITFGVGTTRIDAFEITNSGQCYVKSTQGLRIGNGLITWDSTNNALKVSDKDGNSANLYALGGVSALGFSNGSGINSIDLVSLSITNQILFNDIDYGGTIQTNGGDLFIGTDNNSAYIRLDDICSTDGSNKWFIDTDGNSFFSVMCKSPRFYFNDTQYLFIDNGTLKYYDGSTSKTVVLQ